MIVLWTSEELAAALGGVEVNGAFSANGVSIDSRSLSKSELFIALKGPHFDGHDFVQAAVKNGAAGLIVEKAMTGTPSVLVSDTTQALWSMGAASRNRTSASVLAVTGSVGKTSTKEMLALALAPFGTIHASKGNLNNQWGVPLSLARMPRDTKFGVFELGMNHAGEIAPLSKLVKPDIALITEIAAAHLEFFSSVEEIADAKAEIMEGVAADGTIIVPADSPYLQRLVNHARGYGISRVLRFGKSPDSDAQLLDYQPGRDGAMVTARIKNRVVTYAIAALGEHFARNSLAVLLAVDALRLPLDRAIEKLSGFRALKGRGARQSLALRSGGSIELIDEAYNASPASMRAALAAFADASMRTGRLIAVLGDMRELGAQSGDLHEKLADYLHGIDMVFLCGQHMQGLWRKLPQSQRGAFKVGATDLVAPVLDAIRAGDRVLVKGSLGTGMAPIVDAIKDLEEQKKQSIGRAKHVL